MTARSWPSREEWARTVRTPYLDQLDRAGDAVSTLASDYADQDEIEAARAALWRAYRAGSPWHREALAARRALKGDRLPVTMSDGAHLPEVAAIVVGYRAAVEQAQQVEAERIRNTPIDDEAWRRELDRRARVEARMGVRRAAS